MPEPTTPRERRRLSIVFNPLRVDDLDAARATVGRVCSEHGWEEPVWIETTETETGEKQARQAVDDGADVVASLGGDGTVRAVASGLVGTDVALGLLPGGTGNLLARNLDLPVGELDEATRALVSGRDRTIDVGVVRMGDDLPEPESSRATKQGPGTVGPDEEVFLVMAGFGLDGEIMADTSEKVKEAVGWVAYVLAGAKKLTGRGFPVVVRADEGGIVKADGGVAGSEVRTRARAVIVGNCGTLQGGVELMPDARLDDGRLDAVVLAPRGFFGWGSVVVDVATRHRAGRRRLDRVVGARMTLEAREPVQAEIDGDPIGEHRTLAVRVLTDSLVVRVG